eukprot:350561-Chlamydomonas_euryale.AAC.17
MLAVHPVRQQRQSGEVQGIVTEGTPLCTALSHPISTLHRQPRHENRAQSCSSPILPLVSWPADHATQSVSKQQLLNHRLIRHPSSHVA